MAMRLSTPHCGPLAQLVRASGYNRLISMKHIVPPKNGQVKNICFAKEYIAKKIINSR